MQKTRVCAALVAALIFGACAAGAATSAPTGAPASVPTSAPASTPAGASDAADWTRLALRAQACAAADTPFHRAQLVGAYRAFNDRAHPFSTQLSSLTEQLDAGVRVVVLELHNVSGVVSACHSDARVASAYRALLGDAAGYAEVGCAIGARSFAAVARELAAWLERNEAATLRVVVADSTALPDSLGALAPHTWPAARDEAAPLFARRARPRPPSFKETPPPPPTAPRADASFTLDAPQRAALPTLRALVARGRRVTVEAPAELLRASLARPRPEDEDAHVSTLVHPSLLDVRSASTQLPADAAPSARARSTAWLAAPGAPAPAYRGSGLVVRACSMPVYLGAAVWGTLDAGAARAATALGALVLLEPVNASALAGAVWSWRRGATPVLALGAGHEACVASSVDGWHEHACDARLSAACRDDANASAWRLSAPTLLSNASLACAAVRGVFATPANGYEQARLVDALRRAREGDAAWLSYGARGGLACPAPRAPPTLLAEHWQLAVLVVSLVAVVALVIGLDMLRRRARLARAVERAGAHAFQRGHDRVERINGNDAVVDGGGEGGGEGGGDGALAGGHLSSYRASGEHV